MIVAHVHRVKVEGSTVRNGASIPQHPLVSRKQWDLLRNGTFRQWTYWSVTGPYIFGEYESWRHVAAHVVHPEDAP